MPMFSIPGRYLFQESKNINEYLENLGVGAVVRKVHTVTKPELDITYDVTSQIWTLTVESIFHRYHLEFKLGREVEADETFDIRKCHTLVTVADTQSGAGGSDNSFPCLIMTQTPIEAGAGEPVITRIQKLENGGISLEMSCGVHQAVQVFKPREIAAGDVGDVIDVLAEKDTTTKTCGTTKPEEECDSSSSTAAAARGGATHHQNIEGGGGALAGGGGGADAAGLEGTA